jgi:phosphatidylserine/phosphatidylglycerophosphate/cardiolipin synthase-like enzyme
MLSRFLAIAVALLPLSSAHAADIQACFTPDQDCQGLIVSEIGKSEKFILVQAYSFTSAPIAQALVEAHKRGVEVRAILDKSQRTERYSGATFLANAGIEVLIDAKHAIAHNKVMVLDGETVITGSFNFTKAAQERNAENLLVIRDKHLAAMYASSWQEHELHSEGWRLK